MKKTLLTILLFIATANTASAVSNSVLDFDGSTDYVVVADNAVLDQADRLSLSVWIEPDDTPAGDEYILYRQDAYYIKQTSTNTIVGAIWYGAAWHTVTSAAITSDGATWTHLEMTYDKDATGTDELKLYVNGNLKAVGDNSTAITAVATKLYIGAGDEVGKDNTPENWFDGQIDGVQLYQYARSADDVRLDYNEGLATHLGPNLKTCAQDPASCMDYGLVGSWGFDEGAGTTAYDASDNSNDGILTNGPKWTKGKKNNALKFDGVNDYITSNFQFSIFNFQSISNWINFQT
ncbi:MAG: LamG domain-containing protein, partial [Patescibacteria group bacterium]|nr:LamG domain-containing protein [Patescibacteria group bacterium]